jgi:hypothetical protein
MDFSYEELRDAVFELNLEFDELSGQSKSQKSRELIVYLDRRNRLPELIEYIKRVRPNAYPFVLGGDSLSQLLGPVARPNTGQGDLTLDDVTVVATGVSTDADISTPVYQRDIIGLQNEVAGLRQQIFELISRTEDSNSEDQSVDELIDEIVKTVNRTVGRTEDLKADLILPINRGIRLFMEHDVDRLEEYRSDENIAFLLVGLFAGAAVGIVVNWATDSTFAPTPISITLLLLFAILAIGAGFWSRRLKGRVTKVYTRLPQLPDGPTRT